ncbi:DUF7269 family protein [Halobellus rubicundus]|uniref:Uncharacterized protein n=1 Tax=Halobellus rubicundus TaxID=2996466 RepID=A0ABD5M8R9_9EURY
MTDGDLLVGVGAAVVLLGIAGFAGLVVPGLNASFVFVVLVGLLAGVQGLRYLVRRSGADRVATDPGEPERRYRVPAPGDEIRGHAGYDGDRGRPRRRADVRRGSTRRRRRPPRTLRRRIEEAAVETICLCDHCSVETARRRIDEGTWTDDPVAARYLGADVDLPLSTRIRRTVTRRSRRDAAERALDALEALREGD